MSPKIRPPGCRKRTAEPGLAPALEYNRSRTSCPSADFVWKSVVVTDFFFGNCILRRCGNTRKPALRVSTSPTAESGGGAAFGPRMAATAARNSPSSAKTILSLVCLKGKVQVIFSGEKAGRMRSLGQSRGGPLHSATSTCGICQDAGLTNSSFRWSHHVCSWLADLAFCATVSHISISLTRQEDKLAQKSECLGNVI